MARRRGFTLIELLVVIAVIAVLAAILFPVFAQAREKARQVQCGSQLKQITVAFKMYAQDHDDTLPPIGYASAERGMSCFFTISHILAPYQTTHSVWRCMTNPKSWGGQQAWIGSLGMSTCSPDGYYRDAEVSYVVNFNGIIRTGVPHPMFAPFARPVATLAEIEYPAETSLIYDGILTRPGGACGPLEVVIDGRHQGAMNVGWVDGHVKRLRARETGQSCTTVDGHANRHYVVSEEGPYHGQRTLVGIPYRAANGAWALR